MATIIAQMSLLCTISCKHRQCSDQVALRQHAVASYQRPSQHSTSFIRRPIMSLPRPCVGASSARTMCAPPPQRQHLGNRGLSCKRLPASSTDADEGQVVVSATESAVPKKSTSSRPEFPPYAIIQSGDVYDLRLYEVPSFSARMLWPSK